MAIHIPPVPLYRLYGEKRADGLAEMVHCETIAARSRLHEWEISPHRHAAISQVLFLQSGSVTAQVGAEHISASGPVLLLAPSGIVHGFHFSTEAIGLVVSVSEEYVLEFDAHDPLRIALGLSGLMQCSRQTQEGLVALGEQLLLNTGLDATSARLLLTRSLAESWLRLALATGAGESAGGPEAQHQKFRALIEQHYRRHLPLGFYAGELGCTERTVSRLSQGAFGMSPLEMINRRLALEAQRLLRFTNATCAEVSWELGFSDPSYFSRFYKRMTGERPQNLRSVTDKEQ
ncbi:MAG: helix-turn-helix domain-containing protein [Sphingomonadaceae bacterium]